MTASDFWAFGNGITFLNHGSFGACPVPVLERRERLLRQIELDPMGFMLSDYQPLRCSALEVLTEFTGAEKDSLVFVENCTAGINTILRNIPVMPGEGILVTDQEYFSSMNALREIAGRKGAVVQPIHLPFPVSDQEEILEAVVAAITPETRFALIDHVVSSTGMVLPLKKIIDLLSDFGIKTIVDGAHGPGEVPLDLKNLGCMAYAGNCHKWLCSPRSSAVLYVNPEFQRNFLPLVISHVPSDFDTELSDYQLYFSWNGTPDPTPALCVPCSIDFMAALHPEGWQGVMDSNRELALKAREILCSATGAEPVCPESMVGAMAAVPLEWYTQEVSREPDWIDPLQKWLKQEKGIVVPVTDLKGSKAKMIRLSAQMYNTIHQYHFLAEALVEFRNLRY